MCILQIANVLLSLLKKPHLLLLLFPYSICGNFRWLSGRESTCLAGDVGSIMGQEDPLEKRMTTHSIFLPGESHGQRSPVGNSAWGRKELDMTE